MPFIDKYSWKVFLSTCAKNITDQNGIFHWTIYNRRQVVSDRPIIISDIEYLKQLVPFNFFYFSKNNIDLLKQSGFSVQCKKNPSVVIPISNLDFAGSQYKKIRQSVNKAKKYNLTLENNFRKYDDVLIFLQKWKETCGDKYFQARIGKNKYLLKQNLHQDCRNIFLYDKDDLVSFAVLSPSTNGLSAYIAGKALCLQYPGLSEFTDVEAYKLVQKDTTQVNLGGGGKPLRKYKMKFPGAFLEDTCDGEVI